MDERLRAWQLATEIVNTIVEKHGLEPYRRSLNNGLISPATTVTKVDQHIDEIRFVADWLLYGVDENSRGDKCS